MAVTHYSFPERESLRDAVTIRELTVLRQEPVYHLKGT